MTLTRTFVLSLAVGATTLASAARADDTAQPTDAQARLKTLVAAVKAQGGPATAKAMMAADDPAKCRYKDMVCMIADVKEATLLMHSALPKLAGSPLVGDMLDLDGVSINDQLFGPVKQGKAKWETKYKFARPDTKKIVGRAAFCEKASDSHVVCVSISS